MYWSNWVDLWHITICLQFVTYSVIRLPFPQENHLQGLSVILPAMKACSSLIVILNRLLHLDLVHITPHTLVISRWITIENVIFPWLKSRVGRNQEVIREGENGIWGQNTTSENGGKSYMGESDTRNPLPPCSSYTCQTSLRAALPSPMKHSRSPPKKRTDNKQAFLRSMSSLLQGLKRRSFYLPSPFNFL